MLLCEARVLTFSVVALCAIVMIHRVLNPLHRELPSPFSCMLSQTDIVSSGILRPAKPQYTIHNNICDNILLFCDRCDVPRHQWLVKRTGAMKHVGDISSRGEVPPIEQLVERH